MKRQIDSLARIERLRRRMHDLAKWRLQLVAQERARLEVAHAEMVEALGEGLMSLGAAAVAGSRRVRSIEQDMARAEIVEKAMERQTLDEARLAKLADLRLEAVRDAWREKLDRRSLEELIESSLGERDSPT